MLLTVSGVHMRIKVSEQHVDKTSEANSVNNINELWQQSLHVIDY